jgi:SAM-dependent methyltransferase
MNKKSLRGCPICATSESEVLHTQRFVLPQGHPLAQGYDVVCCHRCGFVFADTSVRQQDYDTFYQQCSKYQDDKTSTGGGETSWDAQRLQNTAAAIADFLGNKSARVLDMGCANGGLLHALKKLGLDRLTGLDPSPICVANTRRLAGVQAEAGLLTDARAQLGAFDCVILSHVLEHVQDLEAAIHSIRQLLVDGGCAYIEVPDASRYAECLAAPFQDFNTEHINHFSLTCLVNLAQRAGLVLAEHGTKTLSASPTVPYPALFAFFRAGSPPTLPPAVVRETELRDRIVIYIQRSRHMMRAIDARLQKVVESSGELIVWGTGQLALKLLAETALGRARIAAFVDGNPINHGRVLHGQRIIAPAHVANLPHPIVITSILHQGEIEQVIRDRLGLRNPLITLAQPELVAEPA